MTAVNHSASPRSVPLCATSRGLWLLLLVLGLAALGGGCDNTVDPFAEDTGLFSVYGYLSVSRSENFVRVRNLNTPPTSDSARTLDATVRLENLDTGTSEVLADSIVTFGGVYTHNVRMDAPVAPGATYRLTVERAEGGQSEATATMPRRPDLAVEPAPTDTVACAGDVLLRFRNLRPESTVGLSVAVSWSGESRWVDQGAVTPTTGFVPWRIVEKALPGYALDQVSDRTDYCTLLDEPEFRIAYTRYGPDWPADSVFADPTASAVENGLGVFGGFQRDTLRRYVHIE